MIAAKIGRGAAKVELRSRRAARRRRTSNASTTGVETQSHRPSFVQLNPHGEIEGLIRQLGAGGPILFHAENLIAPDTKPIEKIVKHFTVAFT
jgi:hypothetical protein